MAQLLQMKALKWSHLITGHSDPTISSVYNKAGWKWSKPNQRICPRKPTIVCTDNKWHSHKEETELCWEVKRLRIWMNPTPGLIGNSNESLRLSLLILTNIFSKQPQDLIRQISMNKSFSAECKDLLQRLMELTLNINGKEQTGRYLSEVSISYSRAYCQSWRRGNRNN